MKDRSLPAKTHLRGAVALVNSRRSEQSDSPFSETLTRAVQFQVVRFPLAHQSANINANPNRSKTRLGYLTR